MYMCNSYNSVNDCLLHMKMYEYVNNFIDLETVQTQLKTRHRAFQNCTVFHHLKANKLFDLNKQPSQTFHPTCSVQTNFKDFVLKCPGDCYVDFIYNKVL